MTPYAVPGPPVQLPDSHVGEPGVPQHSGVAVRAVIGDAQPAAGPQDPHRLAQRLCPPAGFPDVAERQAADHQVERPGRKREVTRVRVGKLHPVPHALGRRAALRSGAAIAALAAAAPHVRSHRPAAAGPPASAPGHGRIPRPARARRGCGGRRLGGTTSPAGFRLAPDRADAGLAVSQDPVAGLR